MFTKQFLAFYLFFNKFSKGNKNADNREIHFYGLDASVLLSSEVRFNDTQTNARPYIPYDGIPFVIIGKKVLDCHHGRDRHVKEKEQRKQAQAGREVSDFLLLNNILFMVTKKLKLPKDIFPYSLSLPQI